MVELNLNEIAKNTGGDILQGSPSISFRTFNIDSRISQPGELFFALVAQRDGHAYIADAAQKGAAGAVISRPVTPPNPDMALIQVPDTLLALQNLAERALEAGLEYYEMIFGVQQTLLNVCTTSLYHLFEQQVIFFLRREILRPTLENQKNLLKIK